MAKGVKKSANPARDQAARVAGQLLAQAVVRGAPLAGAALKQGAKAITGAMSHRQAATADVSQGITTAGAPVSQGTFLQTVPMKTVAGPQGVRYTGRTFLGSVATGNLTSFGIGLTAGSNPLTFQDRMAREGRLFEKYVYNRCRLVYVPAVGTATVGTVFATIRRDYNGDALKNIAEVMDLRAAVGTPVWSSGATAMNRDQTEVRAYFTNYANQSDINETEQFRFEIYYSNCSATNTTLGYAFLEYDIWLTNPIPEPLSVATLPAVTWTYTQAGTFACNPNSNAWSLSIPNPSVGFGLVEIVVTGGTFSGTNLATGSAGNGFPAINGPLRVWARRPAGNGTSWELYLDYVSAKTGANTGSAIYNTSAGNVSPYGGAPTYWWRPLTMQNNLY